MMPTSSLATPSGARKKLSAYAHVEVESQIPEADPHRLILMLMDGFLEAVARARGALRDGNVQVKGESICKATRIIGEGLQTALDIPRGGKLAEDLEALYDYIVIKLTKANLHNDDAAMAECADLLRPIREAWAAIAPTKVSDQAS